MSTDEKQIKKIDVGSIISPQGFKAAGIHSGVKRKRKDLGVVYSTTPANAAAVYTLNKVQAEPIKVTKESIAVANKLQAIIVNSGNANAFSGSQGKEDAYTMRRVTADKFSIPEHFVAVASTGVIGEQMPMDKIVPHIDQLSVEKTNESAQAFGEAILTTDTFIKSTCYEAVIDGKTVTMAGAAKGSGMIEPNMGTMLSFITTDAAIEPEMLQLALKEAVDNTFNCITVDGDTSTNDMVLVMANGLADNETLTPDHADWSTFIKLLKQTSEDLAKLIARDGEGATKLIEVEVSGAQTNQEAIKVAKTVVASSLVKTMIYGTDANWGRVICAVGYSDANINPDTIDMAIGDIELLNKSQPQNFSEEEATTYLENEEVKITINLNIGNGTGKAWGCDLTYDYIKINASYRT